MCTHQYTLAVVNTTYDILACELYAATWISIGTIGQDVYTAWWCGCSRCPVIVCMQSGPDIEVVREG